MTRLAPFALLFALLAGAAVAAPPEEEEEEKKPKPAQPMPPANPPTMPPATPPATSPSAPPATPPAAPPVATTRPTPGDVDGTPRNKPGIPPGQPDPVTPATPAEEDEKPPPPVAVPLPDIAADARRAGQPALKAFLGKFTVAHDRLSLGLRAPVRVHPLPFVWGTDKYPAEFGIAVFDEADKLASPTAVTLKSVARVEHFERFAVDETNALLALPGGQPTRADRLAVAEKVLSSVYLYHGSAIEQKKRRGGSWVPVGQEVYAKLTQVRVGRVQAAADAKDWAKLAELSGKYADLYRGSPETLEAIAAARLAEAVVLAGSASPVDLERARALLADYEAKFPNGKAPAAATVRKLLADRARALLAEAARDDDKGRARARIETAERIDPSNPDIRSMRRDLNLGHPTLVVAARRRPELLSPVRARFDSEKQAVELMFEGLTEEVPDTVAGVRYTPALLAGRTGVGAGVRDVAIVGSAEWGREGAGFATAADLDGTTRMLRRVRHLPAAAPVQWLLDPGLVTADPGRARVRFSRGHPDPRGLLTLKLLPAAWMAANQMEADNEAFARQPFGTGPFRLAPETPGRVPSPDSASDVVFVSNPAYARRVGRVAQPFIKEVRFVDLASRRDPAADIRAGRVHVIPDVPTTELARYDADNKLGNTVRIETAADPKRVHVLAINHRRPALANPDLRRGLTHAVDRNKILSGVFRSTPEHANFHRPLAGPFPPNSWANPKLAVGSLAPLFNTDLAAAKIREYLKQPGSAITLKLLHPADDAQAVAACDQIRQSVDALTQADDRKLTLQLEGVPAAEFVRRVTAEHTYDLAYWPLDYRDAWHPFALGDFLDPTAAGTNGRNVCGFLAPGTSPSPADAQLGQTLAAARSTATPPGTWSRSASGSSASSTTRPRSSRCGSWTGTSWCRTR